MDFIEQLRTIGLKNKAAKAYVALLKMQKGSPHAIAKEAGIERSTVYTVLEELAQQGLAAKTVSGKRISYLAEPPAKLGQLLKTKHAIFEQLLPALSAIQGHPGAKPVVAFYNDIEGIKKVLANSLKSKEKIRRDLVSVDSIVGALGIRFVQRHVEERCQLGIHVRSLRNSRSKTSQHEKNWFIKEKNQDTLREIRYLKQNISFEPFIFMYDNIVAIISSGKESFALAIESPELSQAMKMLFDIAWENSK